MRLPELSLASVPFYVSFIVVTTLGLFVGSFWAFNEFHAYRQSVANLQDNYQKQYEGRVFEEFERIVNFIEYQRAEQSSRAGDKLREKVQSAISIASHVNSLYSESAAPVQLHHMVAEMLRPIRWDNGLGYYFAGSLSTGKYVLHADRPSLENVGLVQHQNKNYRETIEAFLKIIEEKGAGMIRYRWTKPESTADNYEKISFVKEFQPFNWFIGTGVYVDEMENRTQQVVLSRLQNLQFGKTGELMIYSGDGTVVCSTNRKLLGRSFAGLVNDGHYGFASAISELQNSGRGSGFYQYSVVDRGKKGEMERLGYMAEYPEWNWLIATSISKVEMNKAIQAETETYVDIAFKNSALFIILFIIAVSSLLLVSFFYSRKIRGSFNHFTEFFQQATDFRARVKKEMLGFPELEKLGEYANRMNEDRLAKEKVILRDERRLDTLLQLGFMESGSLRKMYEFTLRRLVEITESRAGYFLTIEDGKPVLQSLARREDDVAFGVTVDPDKGPPKRYDKTLERILAQKGIVFQTNAQQAADQTFFPIDGDVYQRVDVPIFENEQIVAILGLCNKSKAYGEEDARQATLLLEGMWLHKNKITSSKEMLKLRQLLKNITDSMPSMLIGIDQSYRVIQWNQRAEENTGVSAAQAEGCLLHEVLPRIKSYEKEMQKVIQYGEQTEIRRIPSGTEEEKRYETLTVYPLIAGDIQGAVLRFDDVTERVAMEEMMIQSEKMISVGGLAAGLAHEINNPLASVKQNLQMVKKRLQSSLPLNQQAAEKVGVELEDIHRYLDERGINHMLDLIDNDSARAVKLIHNMLSFSRKSVSVFNYVDIRELLDSALAFSLTDYDLKNKYDYRRIKIEKDYPGKMREVQCEQSNIQQVFLNLIINATHAMVEKMQDSEEPPCLCLRVQEEDDIARIEIEDNGTGIPRKNLKSIFEPFFTTKEMGKGTGLGLSISYYIVTDQHKGSLQVRSQQGKGSCFVVRLPFEQQNNEEQTSS
ncbi:MAG: cache domain-containing protein [Desulfocapsaceae bacterium]|nr:cache domain-containing protein [Desulfocapsaceae bacterium]